MKIMATKLTSSFESRVSCFFAIFSKLLVVVLSCCSSSFSLFVFFL